MAARSSAAGELCLSVRKESALAGELFHFLVGNLEIGVDILNVVIVFQRVDQLHQRRRLVAFYVNRILRFPVRFSIVQRSFPISLQAQDRHLQIEDHIRCVGLDG